MLGIEDFGKRLQDDLNVIASTITGAIPFKIFTNLGDYTEAYRYDNAGNTNAVAQYQYGILRVLPSEIVPIKGLAVQNFVFQLECAVNIDESEKDSNGNYIQVVNTQEILNNYAQNYTGTTATIDGVDGKSYTIAYAINPCSVSSVTMTTSDYGEVLPVQLTIEVGAVENGINLNDIDITIDGQAVYPLSIQATRKRVPQENGFSNKTSTSIGMLQNGFGLDLQMPLLYNSLGEMILDDIYSGKDNVAHCVDLSFNKYIEWTNQTILYNTIFENRHYSIYSHDKYADTLEFEIKVTSISLSKPTETINISCGEATGVTFNWGDNSSTTTPTHEYTQNGTYKITISNVSKIINTISHKDYCYIMIFGNTSHNTSANTNISPQLSLVEGVPYILNYSNKWIEAEITITSLNRVESFNLQANDILFTGDGTVYYTKVAKTIYHLYQKDGKYITRQFNRG